METTVALRLIHEELTKELREELNDQRAAGWPDLLGFQMQLSEMKRIAAGIFSSVEQADLNVTAVSYMGGGKR